MRVCSVVLLAAFVGCHSNGRQLPITSHVKQIHQTPSTESTVTSAPTINSVSFSGSPEVIPPIPGYSESIQAGSDLIRANYPPSPL